MQLHLGGAEGSIVFKFGESLLQHMVPFEELYGLLRQKPCLHEFFAGVKRG